MAVNYEKKPVTGDPVQKVQVVVDESQVTTGAFDNFNPDTIDDWDPPADHSKDPIFLAILTGAVQKHGVEHYSMANESSVKGRVQALLTATEKIKGVLNAVRSQDGGMK